ncbi:MAG: hypothetical protein M3Q39_07595 [Actinomycetota bacterium]|nr:hypothetical protein [Actinomycetota bacterium]
MSRHRRRLGLPAILAWLGWQRDPGLWSIPCQDGHGHRTRLSVRLGAGWVTLDHPDLGLLHLRPLQVGKLRAALRDALLDLERLGGTEPPAPTPRSRRAPHVGTVPARRVRVVLGRPVTRPTVADIVARLAASASAADPEADHPEHSAAESRLCGMAA